MPGFKLTREFYIPKGSRKVAHKNSDAVAYVYTTANGKPGAAVFYGNQAKPVAHYLYPNETRRETHVTELFGRRQSNQAYVAERREARKVAPVVSDRGYIDTPHAAVMARAALKKAFPGIKFSVRSDCYSMGSHLVISWTDGPAKDAVSALVGPYSGTRFDGMIDMSYSVDSWLLPDGSVVYGGGNGTGGSMGSVPADHVEKPHPEAQKVRFLGSRPSLSREVSPEFQAKCDARWSEMPVSEQVSLRHVLPRWAEDRADRGLAEITAA